MPKSMLRCFLLSAAFFITAVSAHAGEADVIDVKVEKLAGSKYRFHVTVDHEDDGWDHYANAWQVVSPDGNVLGTRKLKHPHVEEMPFTRSHVVSVPAGITEVTVRAGDLVHGYGGAEMTVSLPEK